MLRALRQRLSRLGNMHHGGGAAHHAFGRIRRPLDRAYIRRVSKLDEVRDLAAAVHEQRQDRPARARVIVSALRGISDHNAYEAQIALGLVARGAEVAILTCGGGLPICELGHGRKLHPRPCDRCAWQTNRLADALGLAHFRLVDHLDWPNARQAPREPPPSRVDAAAAARISTIWSLKAATIESQPDGAEVFGDYEVTAAAVANAAAAILDEYQPDVIVLLNGMFAAEHAIRKVAEQRGIRAPTYEIAPRAGALVLSQTGCAPAFEMDRIWSAVSDAPLTVEQAGIIDRVLDERTRGVGAHEAYGFAAPVDGTLSARLGVEPGSRLASLFSNINWDSAFQGKNGAYPGMLDFVTDAVARAAELPGHHLVIRSHPAEVKWGTREPIEPTVRSRLTRIPPNVRFVGPEDPLDSYALVRASEFVLSYATTLGLEAATLGVPVVVGSRVHYAGRGFTTDLIEPGDLGRVFSAPPSAMTTDEVELARRYAYAFFFRGMVTLPGVVRNPDGSVAEFPRTPGELSRVENPLLDFVCECILDGSEFIPDARLLALEEQV